MQYKHTTHLHIRVLQLIKQIVQQRLLASLLGKALKVVHDEDHLLRVFMMVTALILTQMLKTHFE